MVRSLSTALMTLTRPGWLELPFGFHFHAGRCMGQGSTFRGFRSLQVAVVDTEGREIKAQARSGETRAEFTFSFGARGIREELLAVELACSSGAQSSGRVGCCHTTDGMVLMVLLWATGYGPII
jgi:hypothetical protein